MKKTSLIGLIRLGLLSIAVGICAVLPSGAQDANLKSKSNVDTNDAALANMYSVRQDYFKRFPHAKMSEEMRGRIPDTTKPERGARYELPSNDVVLEIPAGPLVAKQTDSAHSADPYIGGRPQYRALYSYCGGIPGAFMPGTPNYITNHSKAASGQGGTVLVLPPNPYIPLCYVQPTLTHNNGNSSNMAQEGDQAIFEYELTTFGVGPISDTQFQMIDRQDNQRFLELLFDPERWLWAGRAAGIMQHQQMSTNMANTADWETNTAMDTVSELLINVANEEAATPVSGSPARKSKSQAIYMVQQMYKQVYLQMAILFLLPGAVMTQMKSLVQTGMLSGRGTDNQSPFPGIVRSVIAIFLIPATQLIISYMIDVGNSATYQVKQWVNFPTILSYAHEQEYGPQRDITYNCLIQHIPGAPTLSNTDLDTAAAGAAGGGGGGGGGIIGAITSFINNLLGTDTGTGAGGDDDGKAYSGPERKSIEEKTPQLSKQIQELYNIFNCAASFGLVVLAQFQMVMMCYLLLLGPIAAAFYAWPEMGGSGKLFNKVFSNWIEGVITLSLWRFWWMVVLACLTTYIAYEKDLGWFDPASAWEMMVFTSFQVLLLVVPFCPFNFQQAAQQSVQQIEQMSIQKAGKEGDGQGSGGKSSAGGGDGMRHAPGGPVGKGSASATETTSPTVTPPAASSEAQAPSAQSEEPAQASQAQSAGSQPQTASSPPPAQSQTPSAAPASEPPVANNPTLPPPPPAAPPPPPAAPPPPPPPSSA